MRWFYCESYTILDLAIIFGQDYVFRLIPKKKIREYCKIICVAQESKISEKSINFYSKTRDKRNMKIRNEGKPISYLMNF